MTSFTRFSLIFAAMLAPAVAMAEADSQAPLIQARCNAMQAGIINGDIESGMQFIWPRLIEKVGGPEKMAAMLKQGAASVKQVGATMTCSLPTQVSQVGSRTLALVPVLTSATVVDKERGEGTFKQWSSTLAISENNGATWYFMTVTERGVPEELLPGGIGKITIPPKDPGTFSPK